MKVLIMLVNIAAISVGTYALLADKGNKVVLITLLVSSTLQLILTARKLKKSKEETK